MLGMLLELYPEASSQNSRLGRLPLQLLCSNTSVSVAALKAFLQICPAAAMMADAYGLPIGQLFCNTSLSLELLTEFVAQCPNAASQANADHFFPLHSVCSPLNGCLSVDILRAVLNAYPEAATMKDGIYGQVPLHYLCMNEHVSIEMLQMVLDAHPAAAMCESAAGGDHGALPLHALCANKSVTADMINCSCSIITQGP
eukprot:gnl/MRDRNA2_/MRDRNA2_77549_c0_seq1.p1 gnl/MRDRNA2_/MRDRNA2_77549_c0~~gnl/MRDRNA2_/MRDRNA2_77549_c0_seq1.p1  ORF type:complete len:210 (+),score=15.78 gnl/MRDRNA2_/MRDRNA2_77549_c0_seq1:33-632(+)